MTLQHWMVLGAIVLVLLWLARRPTRQIVSARDLRVIDGDTVWLADRQGRILEKMRLETINAPEIHGLKSLWEGRDGQRAKAALAALLAEMGDIEIVRGSIDRYDRTLVRLYDGRRRGREIGLQLADAGYARYWES